MGNAKEVTKEKAAAGTSIPAQCKFLVRVVNTELDEHIAALNGDLAKDEAPFTRLDFLSPEISAQLSSIADQITETAQRGLTPAERMTAVNASINEHYKTLPIKDGAASPTPAWEAETKRLFTKRDNIQRSIDKAKGTPEAETAEAAVV